MTKTVDFIFDFASPNAYLVNGPLADMAARTGAKINIIPCLLGGIFKATGNQAPMLAFKDVPAKLAYDNLEFRRFIKKHGLTKFRMNSAFPMNTLLLMRGAIAAQRDGTLDIYITAGMKAMWEDDRKMDDPEVFVTVMNEAGLDGKALLAATQQPEIKAKLISNTESAVKRGAFGIPTFFVGVEMFFGKERLGQLEEMLG